MSDYDDTNATPERSGKEEIELNYPREDWTGFLRHHLGPSLVWALLGIGGSHLVLSPTLGGTFGLFAIWIFAFIYLIKYGCWELGVRYNYAVGKNVFSAYSKIPGPENWAIWLSLISLINVVIFNVAAVGLSSSAFLNIFLPFDLLTIFVVYMAITTSIVALSSYEWLERFLMLFIMILVLVMVLGISLGLPSAAIISETLFNFASISDPVFIGLFASAAGLAPTALSSVFMLSSWTIAKDEGAQELKKNDIDPKNEEYREYIASWVRTGIRDFRVGYLFSFILIIIIATLSANVFYPNPPTDQNLAIEISEIVGNTFGNWSFYVVATGAFAALWSTVIGTMDGGARATVDALKELTNQYDSLEGWLGEDVVTKRNIQIVVLLYAAGGSIPILLYGALPVTLTIFLGVSVLILDSFIYPANLYIVYDNLPSELTPSRKKVAYYLIGIVLMFSFVLVGIANNLDII